MVALVIGRKTVPSPEHKQARQMNYVDSRTSDRRTPVDFADLVKLRCNEKKKKKKKKRVKKKIKLLTESRDGSQPTRKTTVMRAEYK